MEVKEEQIEIRPVSLSRTLSKGVSDVWDHLGLVVASSFIWTAAVTVPLSIGWELQRRLMTTGPWYLLAGLLAALLVGVPLLAGVFKMAYKMVYRDDPSLWDILSGFKELFIPGLGLVLVSLAVAVVLAVNIVFFFGIFGPLKGSFAGYAVGIFSLYLLLIWFAMALYQFPALAAQLLLEQKQGVFPAIKKSFLLVMHNPGFTAGVFVVILGLSILCVVSVIGMPLLFVGTVAILLTRVLREQFVRYGVIEEPVNPEDGT